MVGAATTLLWYAYLYIRALVLSRWTIRAVADRPPVEGDKNDGVAGCQSGKKKRVVE